MWELDHKEGWAPKNWCFWIVVLEKILENPLDCKEIKHSILKDINSEYSLEGLLLKLQYSGPPDLKSWLIGKHPDAGKNWRQKEKRVAEDEIDSITDSMDTCFWANSGRWWRTGKHGMLQFMRKQRVRHSLVTEQQQQWKSKPHCDMTSHTLVWL